MKKLSLLLLLFLACSSHTNQAPQTQPTQTTDVHSNLMLRADPRQGFAPLRVTFHAELKGVSDADKTYHCLKEEWDFGDGAVSSQTPNCEPLPAGGKIERDYITDHLYNDAGTFAVGFTLGEKKLRSNKITVTVLQNLRSPNGR